MDCLFTLSTEQVNYYIQSTVTVLSRTKITHKIIWARFYYYRFLPVSAEDKLSGEDIDKERNKDGC